MVEDNGECRPAARVDADAELLVRAGRGDLSAFHTLVEKHQRALTSFIYRLVHNRADAEDLAQEVLLRVYRGAREFRAESRFATWFYRVATNVTLNHLDSRRRRPVVSLDSPEGTPARATPLTDPGLRPDVQIERRELLAVLSRALHRLPERQRTAVLLSRFEGLSRAETAEVLSCSLEAVDALLRRARMALKDALVRYRGGDEVIGPRSDPVKGSLGGADGLPNGH